MRPAASIVEFSHAAGCCSYSCRHRWPWTEQTSPCDVLDCPTLALGPIGHTYYVFFYVPWLTLVYMQLMLWLMEMANNPHSMLYRCVDAVVV
eukprot:COSAG06_NODE_5541_length_3416_cov_5.780525_2_plen_92_part_00